MTYCLAWKKDDVVYLTADSAVTTFPGKTVSSKETGFNEPSFVSPEKSVEASRLKIYNFGTCAMSFAGNTDLADAIARSITTSLSKSINPLEAFRNAIEMNSPLPDPNLIRVVFACRDQNRSILYSFNANGDLAFVEHSDDVVHLGSVDEEIKEITEDCIIKMSTHHPEDILAKILGFLQSFGTSAELMSHGIGGAFYGLYVDARGTYWQGDILYSLRSTESHPDRLIFARICNNAAFLYAPQFSRFHGLKQLFINYPEEKVILKDVKDLSEYAERSSMDIFHSGKFDYVVFLNDGNFGATVIEMDKKRSHKALMVRPLCKNGRTGLELRKTRALVDRKPLLLVRFISYIKP